MYDAVSERRKKSPRAREVALESSAEDLFENLLLRDQCSSHRCPMTVEDEAAAAKVDGGVQIGLIQCEPGAFGHRRWGAAV